MSRSQISMRRRYSASSSARCSAIDSGGAPAWPRPCRPSLLRACPSPPTSRRRFAATPGGPYQVNCVWACWACRRRRHRRHESPQADGDESSPRDTHPAWPSRHLDTADALRERRCRFVCVDWRGCMPERPRVSRAICAGAAGSVQKREGEAHEPLPLARQARQEPRPPDFRPTATDSQYSVLRSGLPARPIDRQGEVVVVGRLDRQRRRQ
jgi:hypothetical protein